MKYNELKNHINGGGSGIYLLQGEDAYFTQKSEELIKQTYLTMPELNFASFDGETLKGSEIKKLTDALSAYPFMAEKRIVRVREFYPSESDFEKYLKDFFANFPQTSVLIIVNAQTKKGAADLKRKQGICYVDCGKADEEDVAKWIYLTLKKGGVYAAAGVCMNIAWYCLCNMSRVAIEVSKIIEYKGGEGELSQEEADALVYKDADYRIYEMTNAMAAKNYSRFCAILSELSMHGMDENGILNALLSYLRNIITAAEMRGGDAEIAKVLGMKEYGVKRSREQARDMGLKKACALAEGIYGAIAAVKCGELTPASALKLAEAQIFFSEA